MPPSTTTIDHIIYCGDPRNIVATKTFIFEKQVPELAPLVFTQTGWKPPAGIWNTFESIFKSFGSAHTKDINSSHAWTCTNCGKPAKAFCSVYANNLWDRSADKGGLDPNFKPSVVEIQAPVCRHDGPCMGKVLALAQTEECVGRWREMDPKMMVNIGAGLCATCGKDGVMLCAGCREFRYVFSCSWN